MKYAILCDKDGNTQCGTDGYLRLDARNNLFTQIQDAINYRNRFKANFRAKYDYWTHVMFSNKVTGESKPISLNY